MVADHPLNYNITYIRKLIIKEEWLEKESKHLGINRKRWVVLQRINRKHELNAYKQRRIYSNPTASILLDQNTVIEAKNSSQTEFIVSSATTKETYVFRAQSSIARNDWIRRLKTARNYARH